MQTQGQKADTEPKFVSISDQFIADYPKTAPFVLEFLGKVKSVGPCRLRAASKDMDDRIAKAIVWRPVKGRRFFPRVERHALTKEMHHDLFDTFMESPFRLMTYPRSLTAAYMNAVHVLGPFTQRLHSFVSKEFEDSLGHFGESFELTFLGFAGFHAAMQLIADTRLEPDPWLTATLDFFYSGNPIFGFDRNGALLGVVA